MIAKINIEKTQECTPPPIFDTRHFLSERSGSLTDIIAEQLEFPTERVRHLLDLGSVYLNQKRQLSDLYLNAGAHLRVHCLPKRYPVESVDWASRILFANDNFIIVDKPKGFPVPSTVDNVRENVFAQIKGVWNHPLLITQRLDVLTRGLILFAQNSDFQRAFNGLLATGQIYKEYVAKVGCPVDLGLHVHYQKPSKGAPRFVDTVPEGKVCRLSVLDCRWVETPGHYLVRIQLHTGRTHQIRCQMQALNAPLLGDTLYGGGPNGSDFYLCSTRMGFTCPLTGENFNFVFSSPCNGSSGILGRCDT